ncbi:F-box-like domain protein, partial [Rhizoctonia solani 123E]
MNIVASLVKIKNRGRRFWLRSPSSGAWQLRTNNHMSKQDLRLIDTPYFPSHSSPSREGTSDYIPMELTRMRPINFVPVEILTRIFVLVCSVRPCAVSNKLVTLSHVCSYWRSVAISSSTLWTYIYLDPNRLKDGWLPSRTETYLARAGSQLLDVHINDTLLSDPSNTVQSGFTQLLALISPRAWRMTIVILGVRGMDVVQRTIFTILTNCVPGALSHLSIQIVNTYSSPYGTLVPWQEIEVAVEVLGLHITALRLCDFLPKWTSQVYHGLTELRLKCSEGVVSELTLVSILNQNPKLRVLEIDTYIQETIRADDPV